MMVVLLAFVLCAAAGAGLAGGPLAGPATGFIDALHRSGADTARFVLEALAAPGPLVGVTAAAVGSLLPGLVCLLLVEAALAGSTLRRSASLTLVLAAGLSFLFLPAGTAVLLLVGALAASLLLWLATGPLLMGPIAAATGFVAAVFTVSVVSGSNQHIAPAAAALQDQLPLAGLWPAVLSALALLPILGCVVRLLRS